MQEIHAKQALTPSGWVRDLRLSLENGRIARLWQGPAGGPDSGLSTTGPTTTGPTTTDLTTTDLLLPAPVNLHSHAFQRAMSGLTEGRGPDPKDSFWTWRRLMYRFLDRLTPDHVEAIAELVYMEMLEAGYGAVAEFHYLHHDIGGTPFANLSEMAARIVTAARNTGIGLTLLPVLYMQGGCDGRALAGGQRRFGNDIDRFARLHHDCSGLTAQAPADFNIGIAPHSLRAAPPSALDQLRDICPTGPIHMHLAEQQAEVDECQAHLGGRPVSWLLDNVDVTADWCLIHCTQMTAPETTRLAASGAVAGLCPITESSLGDGIFNATTYQMANGHYGVGSDSNVHIGLWEELCTLEYSQRLRDHNRAALATADRSSGRTLLDGVARGGAQASARPSGAIEQGQIADLIAVSTDNEVLCDRQGDALLDSLVFSGRGRACVTDVFSAGRHMVRQGRHIHRDRIVRRFVQTTRSLGQDI